MTHFKWVREIIFLFFVATAACGEPAGVVCFGPSGTFSGDPLKWEDNCGLPERLRTEVLDIEEDSTLRECGEHHIDLMLKEQYWGECDAILEKRLFTGTEGYVGRIMFKVECPMPNVLCKTSWDISFK